MVWSVTIKNASFSASKYGTYHGSGSLLRRIQNQVYCRACDTGFQDGVYG